MNLFDNKLLMKKLLAICIPTYKRPDTLRRCIHSVVTQIQHFGMEEHVQIYIANDASPDNTAQVLSEFETLNCFKCVNREKNLGMSANIKCMLEEAMQKSIYQLIITDDDYLQPDCLASTVAFLQVQLVTCPEVPFIWTPRYSYTEDGKLLNVMCRPFKKDSLIPPSSRNAGRYMFNGFILSGVIIKSGEIDFALWNEYLDNAYFPVIYSGDLMLRKPSLFWDKNIIHHSVLNECHWESWGRSDAEINLRLFVDFMNAYAVIERKIKPALQSVLFYVLAFPGISQFIQGILISNSGFSRLSETESTELLQIDRVSIAQIRSPARVIIFFALTKILPVCLVKMAIFKTLSFLPAARSKQNILHKKIMQYRQQLANVVFLTRWVK